MEEEIININNDVCLCHINSRELIYIMVSPLFDR